LICFLFFNNTSFPFHHVQSASKLSERPKPPKIFEHLTKITLSTILYGVLSFVVICSQTINKNAPLLLEIGLIYVKCSDIFGGFGRSDNFEAECTLIALRCIIMMKLSR
jgi:hypothetical protein